MDTITTVTVTTTPMGGQPMSRNIEVSEHAQKHVLRSFNPKDNDDETRAKVDTTKTLCAALIQQLYDLRASKPFDDFTERAVTRGIELVEGAQMQLVKANFVQA